MEFTIQKSRLSFIWTRLLEGSTSGTRLANMPFLTDKESYLTRFLSLVGSSDNTDPDVAIPWNQAKGASKHNFWSYYLGANIPFTEGRVSGEEADHLWQKFVPFRKKISLQPLLDGGEVTIRLAGYFNCFSVSVLMTIECEDPSSIADLWNLVYDVKAGRPFRLEKDEKEYALQEIGEKAFSELLSSAAGAGIPVAISGLRRDPFILLSVLKGKGVEVIKKADILKSKSAVDLRYALHDISSWKNELFPDRASNPQIPGPAEVLIQNHLQTALGDLFYYQQRGRVIWIPRYFENTIAKSDIDPGATAAEKRKWKNAFGIQQRNQKKITCFHNNILFLHLQLESLALFIKEMDGLFQGPGPLPALLELDDWVRRAVQTCSYLYLGRDEEVVGAIGGERVYKSLSSKHYILDNKILEPLNRLRNRYGFKSLEG